MLVVWDANFLSLLLHQTARLPVTPGTSTPIHNAKERIELLLSTLSSAHATILIPAPALTEFLYLVEESGPGYLQTIDKKSSFEVAPFDEKSAIEAAEMMKKFFREDGSVKGPGEGNKQKVKVDQQIVAIAKAEGVDCLYTSDRGVVNMAKRINVPVIALWELPAPESKTPLLDAADAGTNALGAAPSSEREQPSELFPAVLQETAPAPGQPRRGLRLNDPEPPPPDSSPDVDLPPRSRK